MAARKKRPVMYEVFHPEQQASDPTLKPRVSKLSYQTERSAPADERDTEVVTSTSFSPGPKPAVARDRQAVTISGSTLTVLIAGVIVLLFVAFAAGRKYESTHPSVSHATEFTLQTDDESQDPAAAGDDSSTSEPMRDEATVRQSGADDSADRAASEPASTERPRVTLQRGYHYVVVQHFNKKRQPANAYAAAEFLQANGVACATLTGADIRVIATEQFLINQTDATSARRERNRAEQLKRRIRQLGQQYNKELQKQGKKGYTFSECYSHLIR